MFVAVNNVKGTKYVVLRENVHDEQGKRKQKTLKSFGRLDKLLADDPEALEKLKRKYREETIKEQDEARRKILEEELKGITLTSDVTNEKSQDADSDATLRSHTSPQLCYGLCLLRPIWKEWLGLSARLNFLARNTDIEYDPNEIGFYLTALKIIDPCSQLAAYKNQTKFLYNRVEGTNPRAFYSTLEFFSTYKDEIMSTLNRSVKDRVGRDFSLIYYDCTNCYFKTDPDDRQKYFRRLVNVISGKMRHDGCPCKQIDDYLQSEDFASYVFEQLNSDENSALFKKMRGMSKEHRYDLPLISVALVMDSNGIPIDFKIFPGNTSDFKTLPPSIEELKRKYPIKDTVVVADRGLNSASNLDMLEQHGLGYIVAQKVSNLDEKLEEQMLDIEGYRVLDANRQELGRPVKLTSFDDVPHDAIAYKIASISKTACVEDELNPGKKKRIKVDCTVIFTFSPSGQNRDLHQLNFDVIKARKAVKDHKDMQPAAAGWRSFVELEKEVEEKEQTDEAEPSKPKRGRPKKVKKKPLFKAAAVKEELIEKHRNLAGFGAVIYKKPTCAQAEMEASGVLRTYRSLNKIEECFRIMKSNFSLRPMFVRKEECIEGHVTICVIALIMLRLLQMRLDELGYKLSRNDISDTLRNANLVVHPTGNWQAVFCHSTPPLQAYSHSDYMGYDLDAIVQAYAKRCTKELKPLDMITQAVELKPLQAANSLRDINLRLGIRADLSDAIGIALSAALFSGAAPN